MEEFKLSHNVDGNKIFIVYRSQLEERFEAEYYRPSITFIENIIRKKSSKKLRGFIKSISSGATPSVEQEERFYSSKENGIPFLRVQNLQTNGQLKLNDVKFINQQTHNNYLKRSQVKEGDLLVKITGVGRMAIASVAPKDFEGNTNQHMVVIKTESSEISKYLANYLNLDIIEKLASRRSTGGTRPALDYKALKSIPIIEGIDFSLIHEGQSKKQQKEAEAKELLDSIDDYLLRELGISLPNEDGQENELLMAAEPDEPYGTRNRFELDKENLLVKKGRLFLTKFSEIEGGRWDAFEIINRDKKIEGGKYPNKKLQQLATLVKGQSITSDKIVEGAYPVIAGGQTSPYNHNQYNFKGNVITVSASGAYSGYIWYHEYPIFASDCTVIFSKNENEISTGFLYEILKLKQQEIYNLQQGAGQPHVYAKDLATLNIPFPPEKKQSEIIRHILTLKTTAEQLIQESKEVFENAKSEVERLILNN